MYWVNEFLNKGKENIPWPNTLMSQSTRKGLWTPGNCLNNINLPWTGFIHCTVVTRSLEVTELWQSKASPLSKAWGVLPIDTDMFLKGLSPWYEKYIVMFNVNDQGSEIRRMKCHKVTKRVNYKNKWAEMKINLPTVS